MHDGRLRLYLIKTIGSMYTVRGGDGRGEGRWKKGEGKGEERRERLGERGDRRRERGGLTIHSVEVVSCESQLVYMYM